MVKLGKLFSIFVVLTLLILLAPAVILLPGENVAQGQGDVTQEVEATFSFTEDAGAGGDWHTFTAGSGGIDPEGLALVQYTRDDVVRSTELPGCGFRNYTTASGTVTGDFLSGNMSLAWNAFTFNQTYDSTPLVLYHDYGAGAHFGWMAGRGTIDEDGGDNFSFVFVIDFDSDDATMSNAIGKGFMLSVVENGRFGTDPDPAKRHKIIGDFDIVKSGASYTGNFHLRNYPPDEVFDLGDLAVSGMVKQEDTDPIHVGLELVNITVDTPMSTPTTIDTGFEDIAWGKDPPKYVQYGHLGPNGVMDISRNNPLFLEMDYVGGFLWVYIQGTPICNLYIDDTNTGVRKGDGSPYGKLYQLLLLSLPYQEVRATTPPSWFNQSGYTFTPFGLFNPSTECYAGTESFANAFIQIEATDVDALQQSVDRSYGLYPHPVVESVTPSSGYVGETLDVAIKGKYLLRADDFAPDTGSVNFGPNITVNSYWFKNSSAIDNEIIARITIDADAPTGETRTINVTSCFGYQDGSGDVPYLSGELASAFTIDPLAGATLQGEVSFPGGASRVEPLRVKLFEAGHDFNISYLSWDGSPITSTAGTFIISNLTAGPYDIGIKGPTSLSEQATNVVLGSPAVVNHTVVEGDADDDDYISGGDFSLFSVGYDTWPGQPNWDPRCDFDRDNYLGGGDFSLFSISYDTWGDLLGKVVF